MTRRQGFSIRGIGEILAVLVLLASGNAFSQSEPSVRSSAPLSATSLEPGDFILLKIWREPDLSDTVQVDNVGIAVFPKLGPIQVTGVPPDSLERLLVRDYAKYLQNPSVRVTVLRRITIWGAVARPGAYPVDLTMTITDALALAGGPTSEGKADKVELRRKDGRRVVNLADQTQRLGDTSLRSGDQLVVPRRSWMSRNAGLAIGVLGTVTSLVYLIAR